jgi:hypothetical protein
MSSNNNSNNLDTYTSPPSSADQGNNMTSSARGAMDTSTGHTHGAHLSGTAASNGASLGHGSSDGKYSPNEKELLRTDNISKSSHDIVDGGEVDPAAAEMVQGKAAGKVVNPLAHLTKQQLLEQADAFCVEKGLEEHRDLIRRGALVAQNPASYQLMEELSPEEKDAITYELTHKWSHPWALYFTIMTCSIGAAVQGWWVKKKRRLC